MVKLNWKSSYVTKTLLKKIIDKNKLEYNNGEIKTMSRNTTIAPCFVNQLVYIYNGKVYSKLEITKNMIGYKLGEFSPTRKTFFYTKKKTYGTKDKSSNIKTKSNKFKTK